MSRRVRVQGDLFHGRVPEGSRYIGRGAPGLKASPYANPYPVKRYGADSLRLYAEYLDAHPELVERARREIGEPGLDVACWCKAGPCHGDILLERISTPEPD